MKRNHSDVKPCWPLFRKKCEACGRMFRWERGVKWRRKDELTKRAFRILDGVDKTTCYLCARCAPPPKTSALTVGGMTLLVDLIRSWPTVNDDMSSGYKVGQIWSHSRDDLLFICVDNTTGAAVWQRKSKYTIPVEARRASSITAEEAARIFARAGRETSVRLEDIHIPRRSTKENP